MDALWHGDDTIRKVCRFSYLKDYYDYQMTTNKSSLSDKLKVYVK